MKVNEAPERIYLVIDPVWGCIGVNYNRNDTDNIEYIRTDAFIERTWKPSDEQMKALKRCCDGWSDNGDGILDSLYEQLKKLK